MAQPTPYTRQFNLTTYALNNPAAPYNAANVDAEFNAILTTLDETLANLALIQRDDGGLQNGVVTPDSLDQATINMIGEWNPRGAWVTATNYALRDMVTPSGGTVTYVAAVAHTSGATFAGDLALGYWQPVNDSGLAPGGLTPASITFSATDRVLGRSTAGAGTGEEIVCTAFGRSLIDDANAAAGRTTLGLGVADPVTFASLSVSTLIVSTLTPNGMLGVDLGGAIYGTAAATNGQLLVGSTGATPVLATLTGTANQVSVTNGPGSITLSLPQSIAATSSPTFATANLTNLQAGWIPYVGPSSEILGTSLLVWDNTNRRVGIGYANPAYSLDVRHPTGPATINVEGPTTAGTSDGRLRLAASLVVGSGFVMGVNGFGVSHLYVADETRTNVLGGLNTTGFLLPSGGAFAWGSGANSLATPDLALYRDSANTLAQRNSTTAQHFKLSRTYSSSTNYEGLLLSWSGSNCLIATEKGSGGGTARSLLLGTDRTERWGIGATSGHLTAIADNTYDIGAAGATRPRSIHVGTSVVLPTGTLLGQVTGRATADQSLTTQTTLQDATNMSFSIAANEEWVVEFALDVGAGLPTTGIKLAVNTPAGATVNAAATIASSALRDGDVSMIRSASIAGAMDFAAVTSFGAASALNAVARVSYWILNGANAGTVQLQFAQSTSSGTALVLRKGSHFTAHRVA